jgi:hypothetical protein
VAYPVAEQIAGRQGFKGLRWMKMTDPWAGEALSNTGSFLIWQQPHYIYLAEEMYRAKPTSETLERYCLQVEETAAFMADFVTEASRQPGISGKSGRSGASGKPAPTYILQGATAMQESMSKDFSYNHPFELAYWQYGLRVANEWRERMGKPRHAEWDRIIDHLSPLPQTKEGIYTAGLPKGKTTGLKSFDPFDAVAAGAALVALGSAVKSSLASVAGGDYSAAGSGYSGNYGSGSSSGDYETRDVKVYVTGTLEADGDKLITVINNTNKKNYYTQ